MRAWLQHRLNATHVYCRLKDLGVSAKTSARIAAVIEWVMRPILYGRIEP